MIQKQGWPTSNLKTGKFVTSREPITDSQLQQFFSSKKQNKTEHWAFQGPLAVNITSLWTKIRFFKSLAIHSDNALNVFQIQSRTKTEAMLDVKYMLHAWRDNGSMNFIENNYGNNSKNTNINRQKTKKTGWKTW